MLICNEGDSFYDLDRSAGYPNFRITLDVDRLYGEIRHAWGMMTAGGYYSIYFGPVPLVGDETSTAAAEAMQAMRQIVEMTRFEALRPVRDDGSELDDLVSAGPGGAWQVIADPGTSYLAYFWGEEREDAASIMLPAGHYRYSWMDTRSQGPALAGGEVGLAGASLPATTTSDRRQSHWLSNASYWRRDRAARVSHCCACYRLLLHHHRRRAGPALISWLAPTHWAQSHAPGSNGKREHHPHAPE